MSREGIEQGHPPAYQSRPTAPRPVWRLSDYCQQQAALTGQKTGGGDGSG